MGIPGHFMIVELLGDVRSIHRGVGQRIAAVLLRVHVGPDAPVDIAILAERWPADLREGMRLWVKGTLAQERAVAHRKNVHYIAADHLRVCRPWTARYEAERGAH
jgi:hypothetical protein